MKVVFLDGYNLIHRARHSFKRGEHSTIYSFFRSLRPLIEKLDPDFAYFVVEGYPKDRFKLYPDYKANRPRLKDHESFIVQKNIIISMLKSYFPMAVVKHPFHEGDDVIGNLIERFHASDECVVVSTDTDFLQLYNRCNNVVIYNPIRKMSVTQPDYDYVKWKALRGDASDNIHGIKGIGDKRAESLVLDENKLNMFLFQDPERKKIFDRNLELIRFADIGDQLSLLESSLPQIEWDTVRQKFEELEFYSITNDKSWIKFQNTFVKLQQNYS